LLLHLYFINVYIFMTSPQTRLQAFLTTNKKKVFDNPFLSRPKAINFIRLACFLEILKEAELVLVEADKHVLCLTVVR